MSADTFIAVREQDHRYHVTMEFASSDILSPIAENQTVGRATFDNYQDAVDYAFGWAASDPYSIEHGVTILCDNPNKPEDRDIEFEILLDDKVHELDTTLGQFHLDFESIDALCTLVQNKHMTAEEAIHRIQQVLNHD